MGLLSKENDVEGRGQGAFKGAEVSQRFFIKAGSFLVAGMSHSACSVNTQMPVRWIHEVEEGWVKCTSQKKPEIWVERSHSSLLPDF